MGLTIFKDCITNDELASNVYTIKENGPTWEIDCRMVTVGGEQNYDIGGNASAEEPEEATEMDTKREIDLVDAFQLVKMEPPPKKDEYRTHLKKYLKQVKEHMEKIGKSEEEVAAFMQAVPAKVKELTNRIDNFDFYMGSSSTFDAMLVVFDYREDGVTPYATLWKDGLIAEKV